MFIGKLNSNLAPENDVNGDLLSYALNVRKGLTVIYTGTRTTNTPVTYGAGYILKRNTDTKVLVYDVTSDKFWQNCNPGGATWKGWSSYVTNADIPYRIRTGNASVETGGIWVSKTISFSGFSSPPEIFLTQKTAIGGVANNVSMAVQVRSASSAVIYAYAQGDVFTFDISWVAIGN